METCWFYIYLCVFSRRCLETIARFWFPFLKNKNTEEARDAVLVTDGDSDIGQVCVMCHWFYVSENVLNNWKPILSKRTI